jgi:hypothetical protein
VIIDLRDYTTAPGARDRLIDACERLFFPEQERLGAKILGLFRDAGDPNRYVWLRGVPDMETRARVLTAFYTDGAMWKAQRDEVNGWIADSDNVLLMRPVTEIAAPAAEESVVGMYTRVGKAPLADGAAAWREIPAAIERAGGRLLVTLATDPAENNYPHHPIRTGEHGFVWLATFAPERMRPLGVASIVERRLMPASTSWLR